MQNQPVSIKNWYLSAIIGESTPDGDNQKVEVLFTGSIPTHVIGRDPDDGSPEHHYEPVDQTEVLTIPNGSPFYLIRKMIEGVAEVIEQNIKDGLQQHRDIAETNNAYMFK